MGGPLLQEDGGDPPQPRYPLSSGTSAELSTAFLPAYVVYHPSNPLLRHRISLDTGVIAGNLAARCRRITEFVDIDFRRSIAAKSHRLMPPEDFARARDLPPPIANLRPRLTNGHGSPPKRYRDQSLKPNS